MSSWCWKTIDRLQWMRIYLDRDENGHSCSPVLQPTCLWLALKNVNQINLSGSLLLSPVVIKVPCVMWIACSRGSGCGRECFCEWLSDRVLCSFISRSLIGYKRWTRGYFSPVASALPFVRKSIHSESTMYTLTLLIALLLVSEYSCSDDASSLSKRVSKSSRRIFSNHSNDYLQPFCNTFTGCGRKRLAMSPLSKYSPAITSDNNVAPSNELLQLSAQILQEAKQWEAMQPKLMQLFYQEPVPLNYPHVLFSSENLWTCPVDTLHSASNIFNVTCTFRVTRNFAYCFSWLW